MSGRRAADDTAHASTRPAAGSAGPARILALGAHCDDIEIGCGGTLLRLAAEHPDVEVRWVVFCSDPTRAGEARPRPQTSLRESARTQVVVHDFRDGFLPYPGAAVKEAFEALKQEFSPDVIFTHYRDDRHQDHRLVSELTWNTWRNHLILEYEIPKYDGDFGSPNFFVPLPARHPGAEDRPRPEALCSQAEKHWFTRDLLQAVARIRGMECVAPERWPRRSTRARWCPEPARPRTRSLSTGIGDPPRG